VIPPIIPEIKQTAPEHCSHYLYHWEDSGWCNPFFFAWLVRRLPTSVRRGALTALAAAPVIVASLIEGNEIVCVALLLLAWEQRHRRWVRTMLLGLSCAYRQHAPGASSRFSPSRWSWR
jgi:hypothetical protein